MLKNLILQNRSYRRFREEITISRQTLVNLIDLARHSPSAGNKQPLKYLLSFEPEKNSVIFPHLSWAAYLKDWLGPEEGERPAAYIVILGDTRISMSFGYDAGIAVQSILLGSVEIGLGGCIVASIRRSELQTALGIPDYLEILLVVALGQPAEEVQIEQKIEADDIRYWRDERGIHHVPKRSLEELIIA